MERKRERERDGDTNVMLDALLCVSRACWDALSFVYTPTTKKRSSVSIGKPKTIYMQLWLISALNTNVA